MYGNNRQKQNDLNTGKRYLYACLCFLIQLYMVAQDQLRPPRKVVISSMAKAI